MEIGLKIGKPICNPHKVCSFYALFNYNFPSQITRLSALNQPALRKVDHLKKWGVKETEISQFLRVVVGYVGVFFNGFAILLTNSIKKTYNQSITANDLLNYWENSVKEKHKLHAYMCPHHICVNIEWRINHPTLYNHPFPITKFAFEYVEKAVAILSKISATTHYRHLESPIIARSKKRGLNIGNSGNRILHSIL